MTILVMVLGGILGSFYACMGYRIPNKISLVKPGSFCERCKKEIKWYMNVPFFSYIFLKGKCAYCKEKIDPLSFIVEIITSILFGLFYIKYGFSTNGLIGMVLTSVLAVTIVSDFKYYYISDRVLLISYIITLIIVIVNKSNIFLRIVSSIFMFSLFLLVKLIGDKALKRESLGGGDIKLMGLIGLCLTFEASMISLLTSSIIALMYSVFYREKVEIPFGPFLLIGALVVIYFIPNISFIS